MGGSKPFTSRGSNHVFNSAAKAYALGFLSSTAPRILAILISLARGRLAARIAFHKASTLLFLYSLYSFWPPCHAHSTTPRLHFPEFCMVPSSSLSAH